MEWYQFFLLITAYIATYWFSNKEIKALALETDRKIEMANKKIEAYREDTTRRIDLTLADIKDFHGRLCAIEERKKSKLT